MNNVTKLVDGKRFMEAKQEKLVSNVFSCVVRRAQQAPQLILLVSLVSDEDKREATPCLCTGLLTTTGVISSGTSPRSNEGFSGMREPLSLHAPTCRRIFKSLKNIESSSAQFFSFTKEENLLIRQVFKAAINCAHVKSELDPQHCLIKQKRFSKAS